MESLVFPFAPSFLVFIIFAAFTTAGAIGVAFSQNIVYSAFSLLAAFSGMVGLFVLLSADFLAAVQLMVYVGGILVIILFAVMLTNRITTIETSNPSSNLILGSFVLVAMLAVLLGGIAAYPWPVILPEGFEPTTQMIGTAFLDRFILPFEVSGILLLAAMLAAVVVARKEIHAREDEANTTTNTHGDAS